MMPHMKCPQPIYLGQDSPRNSNDNDDIPQTQGFRENKMMRYPPRYFSQDFPRYTNNNDEIPQWFKEYKMKTDREINDLKRQVNILSNRQRGNGHVYPYLSITNDDGREPPHSFPILSSVDCFRNLSDDEVLKYLRFYKLREDNVKSNRYNLARFCGCTSGEYLLQKKYAYMSEEVAKDPIKKEETEEDEAIEKDEEDSESEGCIIDKDSDELLYESSKNSTTFVW